MNWFVLSRLILESLVNNENFIYSTVSIFSIFFIILNSFTTFLEDTTYNNGSIIYTCYLIILDVF